MASLNNSNPSSQLQDEGPSPAPHDPVANIQLTDENITNIEGMGVFTGPNQLEVAGCFGPIDDPRERARRQALALIARGRKTAIYTIPESFGRYVVKVGPYLDIHRETKVIQGLTRAYRDLQYLRNPDTDDPLWMNPRELRGRLQELRGRLPRIPEIRSSIKKGPFGRIPEEDDEEQNKESKQTNGQAAIVLRRIRGLPDSHRKYVLDQFYQHESKGKVLNSPKNDNLLVRVYLGENSEWYHHNEDKSNEPVADDVDLYDETMPFLDIPGYADLLYRYSSSNTQYLAQQMAYGYAVLHWGARYDGRGVEFLLGLTKSAQVRLHMLDFEECEPFVCWTRKGVSEQLVPAAVDHGLYIPRPCVSMGLWRAFVDAYLEASNDILKANAGPEVWDVKEMDMLADWVGQKANQGLKARIAGEMAGLGLRHGIPYDDWDDQAEKASDAAYLCHNCRLCGCMYCIKFDSCHHPHNECDLAGYEYGSNYEDADEKIRKLPRLFIRELEAAFEEKFAEDNASAVSNSIISVHGDDEDGDDEDGDDEDGDDEDRVGHNEHTMQPPSPARQAKQPDIPTLASSTNGKRKRAKEVTFEEPLPKRNKSEHVASESSRE